MEGHSRWTGHGGEFWQNMVHWRREWQTTSVFMPWETHEQSVQSLSRVWLFATPWTIACQASLSINNSQSLLKLMSIESVIPSNHLILCGPLLLPPSIFPNIRVFSNESDVHIRLPSIGVSASASVLPMNNQDWFPLGWTGWISLQSKGLLRVFSNTTASILQRSTFFMVQLSHPYTTAGKTIALTRQLSAKDRLPKESALKNEYGQKYISMFNIFVKCLCVESIP